MAGMEPAPGSDLQITHSTPDGSFFSLENLLVLALQSTLWDRLTFGLSPGRLLPLCRGSPGGDRA